MSGPMDPPSTDRSSRAQVDGDRLQWLLFGVGGVLFLSAALIIVGGIPGGPIGSPDLDDVSSPTPTPAGGATPNTAAPTASPEPPATDQPKTTGTAAQPPAEASGPVYRVNVGGPKLVPPNGPAWAADLADSPSQYLNARESQTAVNRTPDPIRIERGVSPTASKAMFRSYRFDTDAGEEMTWRFPVQRNHTYEVRVYVMEAYFTDGTGGRAYEVPYEEGGPRYFGIEIEDREVIRNYEPFREHGHDVGGMKTFTATPADGVLTIRFLHQAEDPTVSGIEIIDKGPKNETNS